jgi:hypothetical protein
MKAMLEARMVAASIQVLAPGPHGADASPDPMTDSSQGVFIDPMDAI